MASSGFGDIAPFTAQNGGQSAVNALITVTPEYTSGGVTCSGSTEDFTITVNTNSASSTDAIVDLLVEYY